MRQFAVVERRRRLLARQHLATPAPDVETVAGDLVGLHSTDPATVYLSACARLGSFAVADLEAALYGRRSVLRVLGMRRTMFVAPRDLVAVIDAACTRALVAGERKRTIELLSGSGIADAEALIERAGAETLDVLRRAPEPVPARALTPQVPALQTRVTLAAGKNYEATPAISNRILLQLSIEGRIMRGPPLGSWLSSQYRWTTTERWIGTPLQAVAAPEARHELVRRWLGTYGPGTTTDIAWWTKWSKRDVAAALREVAAVEVTAEPAPGAEPVAAWVLPDDLDGDDASEGDEPVISLLPSLDQAIMGWKERRWYLGDHAAALFDRNGNAGPVILVGGAVVGGWGQRADGRVITELLETVDDLAAKRVDAAAEELTEWFDGVRVTPRFPTPLQTRLAKGG